MSSVSDNPVFLLNIDGEPPPTITQNQTSFITKFYRFPVIATIMYLKCMWTDYFRSGTLGEEGLETPGSVPDNPEVILNINDEEPPPTITQNQTSFITKFYRFPVIAAIMYLKCMWTHYFWPGTLGEEVFVPPGSVPDNPVVPLNINGEEMPAEANNQTSFVTNVHRFLVRSIELVCRLWTQYFPRGTSAEEGLVPSGSVPDNPGSALNFVIIGLFSFTAIKSQGETRFPFHSNPQTIMVAITCLIVYGLFSEAENVIVAARPGPHSVYVLIARLVKKLCLYVLMVAMASLFIL